MILIVPLIMLQELIFLMNKCVFEILKNDAMIFFSVKVSKAKISEIQSIITQKKKKNTV